MKISIITVCYNSESTIRETILSVLNQVDHTDEASEIEYIIIDGKSQDNTLNIINEYRHKINYVISEKDKGIYDAMNKGIQMATGDIIGILNSDDIFADKSIISTILQTFNANKSIDAIYGNIYYFQTENPSKSVRFWKSKDFSPTFFEDGYVIPHPTLFVKKEVYQKVGLYYPHFKISSDYEWMLRAFKIHNFYPFYIDRLVVKMRIGGESTKSWKNILIGNIEIYRSWKMNNRSIPFLFFLKRFVFKIKQLINNEPSHHR